jgi:hypothetical protein
MFNHGTDAALVGNRANSNYRDRHDTFTTANVRRTSWLGVTPGVRERGICKKPFVGQALQER